MGASRMEGRVAIVTGGARGIGGASAVELAARGADIVLNDQNPRTDAEAVVSGIQAHGRRVLFVQGDVAQRRVNEELVDRAVQQFGRLDVVVCNAARGMRKKFVELDPDEARRLFDLIFWGGFYLSQFAARQMIRQGAGGSIIFISSVHAVRGYPGAVAYNAAKAAINHMARSIALELAPHRIRVNWIEPGWIDTPGERIVFGDEIVEQEGKKLLWGRLGHPEEIARGVAFLASDDSSYMTGAGLRLDGGFVLPD